jgi:hypothetical protein
MTRRNERELIGVYSAIRPLPRQTVADLGRGMGSNIPQNGIYLLFERGERISVAGTENDRVVRVGTHKVNGGLKRRLRQHYRGNKNASTFRRDVGSAMLSRSGVSSDIVSAWMGRARFERSAEQELSEFMDSQFTFSCIAVDPVEQRMRLEQDLIAFFASHAQVPVEDEWLGRWAARPVIRESRLWNLEHVDAEPLTSDGFRLLAQAILTTLQESDSFHARL